MYISCNIDAHSCNDCCIGKTMSITYSERVSSLRCTARNAHAPCCHLWLVWLYKIFSQYLINGAIFVKNVMQHELYVLIFSTAFVWDVSYSKKNWARYDQKCIIVFIFSTRYNCQILMNLEFSWQIFEKYSSINFHENPISGSRVVPCGRTDGRTGRQIWRSQ